VKALEQLVIRARAGWRTRRARVGGTRPARLLLRIDDFDAPGEIPAATLDLDKWFDLVVRVVEWGGALPVTIVSRVTNPLLAELVRFCHRLECPTSLRTGPADLTLRRAEELVDMGLAAVAVRMDAASREATDAIAALVAARASRGLPLDIVAELPPGPGIRERWEAARAAGADGAALAAPWRGAAAGGDGIAWAKGQGGRFQRTRREVFTAIEAANPSPDQPGRPGRAGACPVGSLRLEALPDGTLRSCPFQPGAVPAGDRAADAWAALADHRAAIRRCDRACAHPDLL
jgi:hypothetical protein